MRTGIASVEELVAHGGWALDDVPARRAANPDTFWLPPPEDLERLVPGTQARLIFQVLDQADPILDGVDPYDATGRPNLAVAHERMWVWVESVSGSGADAVLVGVLMNAPVGTHSQLVPGARVEFRPRDVIDVALEPSADMHDELEAMTELGFPLLDLAVAVAPEDPLRPPSIAPSQAEVCARSGARPERPAPVPFVQCLLGRGVNDGVWPIFGARSQPRPERNDCGWSIWSGHSDLGAAEAADGFDVVPITDVAHRSPAAWAHIALPPGWAFVLGADGYADVYQYPEIEDEPPPATESPRKRRWRK